MLSRFAALLLLVSASALVQLPTRSLVRSGHIISSSSSSSSSSTALFDQPDSDSNSDSGFSISSLLGGLGEPDSPTFRKVLAAASSMLGAGLFALSYTQPVSGVALLHVMEKESMPLEGALCNGKPTLVEFYADWCESCKVLAPSMRSMEARYKGSVNFITVDGVNPQNSELVAKFKVDGIPHVAFLTSQAEVKTALVGAVPASILNSEIKALVQGKPLPFEGYDAFEEQDHFPFGSKETICAAPAS
mmetsp:Transcript_28627/g.63521  ORF Transcript_28627/g.63521 Transcript_28627/m.63521 type:complete len:247 (+) Transcript_28627:117-857(+)